MSELIHAHKKFEKTIEASGDNLYNIMLSCWCTTQNGTKIVGQIVQVVIVGNLVEVPHGLLIVQVLIFSFVPVYLWEMPSLYNARIANITLSF